MHKKLFILYFIKAFSSLNFTKTCLFNSFYPPSNGTYELNVNHKKGKPYINILENNQNDEIIYINKFLLLVIIFKL